MPGTAEQAVEHSDGQSFDTIAQAVAELDRRDEARKADRKAERKVAKGEAETDTTADEVEDEDADPRRVEKPKPEAKKADSDKEEKKPPREAKAEEDEGDEEDADPEQDEGGEDDPDEDDDSDDEKSKAKARESRADDDDSVEIEHDGQKHRVPKALKDSFLRHADYTQKTTQLAQDRQVTHQVYGQAQSTLQQLTQMQSTLVQFAQAALGEEPPIELARENPGEYAVQRALHENRRKAMEHIAQHSQQLQAEQQRLQETHRQQQLHVHMQALVQQAPELREPAARQQFGQVAGRYLQQFGFAPEDAMQITDARTLLLVRRLLQLEHASAQREKTAGEVKKRLADVPPKTLKPGSTDAQGAKRRGKEEARRKFLGSGRSMKDVERYLAST